MKNTLALFMVLAAMAQARSALAAPPPSPAPAPAAEQQAGQDAVTHHTMQIDGRTMAYTATAGSISLRNQKGEVTATMFYTAFTEDGADSRHRPVTFLFNGGPGSSTIWLRMGSVGPKRVLVGDAQPTHNAPFELVDNQYSLLDKSDLVFVDAVGTGFSRIVKGQPKDFYGVDPDIRAFGQFVQRYITQNNRWDSPKFLFGESYGTPRACGMANYLQNQGIQLSGIILLSSALNFAEFYGGDGNDEQFMYYVPTEAAIAWYHHRVPNRPSSLAAFVDQAERFALGEYADALLKGANVGAAERDDVVRKLHAFTGVSEQFLRDAHLRMGPGEFEKQLLHRDSRILGRYDARFVGVDLSPTGEFPDYDPSDSYISGAFVAAMNDYVRNDLRYRTNEDYRPTNYGEINANWDFTHTADGGQIPFADLMPDLRDAMTRNPRLMVFSASGYYDMATPFFGTDYLLAHLDVDPSLQKNIWHGYYESGHMVYLHVPALAQFKSDLARFYDAALRS